MIGLNEIVFSSATLIDATTAIYINDIKTPDTFAAHMKRIFMVYALDYAIWVDNGRVVYLSEFYDDEIKFWHTIDNPSNYGPELAQHIIKKMKKLKEDIPQIKQREIGNLIAQREIFETIHGHNVKNLVDTFAKTGFFRDRSTIQGMQIHFTTHLASISEEILNAEVESFWKFFEEMIDDILGIYHKLFQEEFSNYGEETISKNITGLKSRKKQVTGFFSDMIVTNEKLFLNHRTKL